MAFVTGNTATAAFTTNTAYNSFAVRSISPGGQSVPAIDTSHLGTTNFTTYIAGDLIDCDTVTLELIWDPTQSEAVPGTGDTLDITWPLSVLAQTAAVLDGSGFVESFSWGDLVNNELATATLVWRWDNDTAEVTWTAETTP